MECPWTFRGTNFLFRPQFSFLTKVHGKSTEIHGIRQIPWIPYVKVGDCKVLHILQIARVFDGGIVSGEIGLRFQMATLYVFQDNVSRSTMVK